MKKVFFLVLILAAMTAHSQITINQPFELTAKYPLDYNARPILTVADTEFVTDNKPYGFRVYCIADGSTWRFNYLGQWEQVQESAPVDMGYYSFDGGLMSVLGQSVISGNIGDMYMNEDQEMNVYIRGPHVEFPDLTNSIINAGGDQYATTKGWVNSKIPSLGNYSFSYNNMSTSDGNIISITGVNNIIDIGTPDITETLNLNAQGIFLVNSSISDINSAPDKVAVTKEWVNAKNLQSDWNQTDNTANDYIKNKPSIGSSPAWGDITGTLTDQTDLITYLSTNYGSKTAVETNAGDIQANYDQLVRHADSLNDVVTTVNAIPSYVGDIDQDLSSGAAPTFSAVNFTDMPTGGGTTFTDAAFDVHNSTDATKIFKLNASAITAGTTRTLDVPDFDGKLVAFNSSKQIAYPAANSYIQFDAANGLILNSNGTYSNTIEFRMNGTSRYNFDVNNFYPSASEVANLGKSDKTFKFFYTREAYITRNLGFTSAPAANLVSGVTINATAGEALSVGDICYTKSDGKLWKADNTVTTSADLYMATGTIAANASGVFLVRGWIESTLKWGASPLTVGNTYYLPGIASTGGITDTRPSASGAMLIVIGTAVGSTTFRFNPQPEPYKIP